MAGHGEAAIRDKITSYESSIDDAELRREIKDLPQSGLKNWHGHVAGKHEAIGYLRTVLCEHAAAREHFSAAAEHYLSAHECRLEIRRELAADPDEPANPSAALDALYAGLLAGNDSRIDTATDAVETVVGGVPDRLDAHAHYYLHPSVVAGVAADRPDVSDRIRAFERQVEQYEPADAALYRRLLPVFSAIATVDEGRLPTALADLQAYHAKYQSDDENVVTRTACKFLLRSLALAKWRGMTVDEEFEYGPALPWGEDTD